MRKSKARMSQRIREGRGVSVFTRFSRTVCVSGGRCRIIQTPGLHDTTSRIKEGGLIGLLCSLRPHDERGELTPVPVPCSRSAHDQNVLARRPQGDQHRCHSKGERQASLEGALMCAVGARFRPSSWMEDDDGEAAGMISVPAERTASEGPRSTRAVETTPAALPGELYWRAH